MANSKPLYMYEEECQHSGRLAPICGAPRSAIRPERCLFGHRMPPAKTTSKIVDAIFDEPAMRTSKVCRFCGEMTGSLQNTCKKLECQYKLSNFKAVIDTTGESIDES